LFQKRGDSHPSTGIGKNNFKNYTYVNPVISNSESRIDGFLKSGNVQVEIDSLGDAAALDVENFLKLKMADGNTLLEHIKNETALAKKLLNIKSESYDILREGFLAIIKSASLVSTSSKIKQVFFPVNGEYHQLSLLTNSGLIYKLKERIDNIRFSSESIELRDRKRNNIYSEKGFLELYNLTTIGYGGANPQNISVLSTENRGKAHLLMSAPPRLQERDIYFPKKNFFIESFWEHEYRDTFHALHKLFKTDYNNVYIREGRDYRIQSLLDLIIDRMWAVRAVCKEQYQIQNSKLKSHQKYWLCDEFIQNREIEDNWLNTLCKEITVWIIRTYERLLGKNAFKLGESERMHIHTIVLENKEDFR
jgi:CRISPR-associated protein Csy1